MRSASVVCLAAGLLLVPCVASADNTTFANAQNIVPNQPLAQYSQTSATNRFWVFNAVAGRSYCVEISAPTETAAISDSGIVVFRANQTTQLANNDDTLQEPFSGRNSPGIFGLSRGCWIAPATEATYLVTFAYVGTSWWLRLVETTLYSNWFFLNGDYSAFVLIRNTTSTSLSYTVNWRDQAGSIVATTTATLPGHGGTFLNARSFSGALAALFGTVEIVHNSSPDAVSAGSTVLSPTTGLSFDSTFIRRQ